MLPGASSQTFCDIQASLIIYTSLSSVLWSASIANTLYNVIVKQDTQASDRHLGYHLMCCIPPAFVVVLANTIGNIDNYQSDVMWCWIANDGSVKDNILRAISLYIPLWSVIIYNTFTYSRVILAIKQEERYLTHESEVKMQLVRRLRAYPAVLLLCYSLTSVYRFMQLVEPNASPSHFIKFLGALFSTLAGFVHAILYGLNPVVKRALYKCVKSSKVIKYELLETDASKFSESVYNI